MAFHNRYCFVIHVYTCSIAMFTTELEQAGWRHLDMKKSSILTCLWSIYWTASQSYSLNFNDVHLVIPFNVNCFFVTNIFFVKHLQCLQLFIISRKLCVHKCTFTCNFHAHLFSMLNNYSRWGSYTMFILYSKIWLLTIPSL